MNTEKISRAISLLTEAIAESCPPTKEDWARFGMAVADAGRIGYSVWDVCIAKFSNNNWKSEAFRLWEAAKDVGLR